MAYMKRTRTNKYRSAKQFRSNSRRTKAPNMSPPPNRGGFRF